MIVQCVSYLMSFNKIHLDIYQEVVSITLQMQQKSNRRWYVTRSRSDLVHPISFLITDSEKLRVTNMIRSMITSQLTDRCFKLNEALCLVIFINNFYLNNSYFNEIQNVEAEIVVVAAEMMLFACWTF